jgi:hypothetical protein
MRNKLFDGESSENAKCELDRNLDEVYEYELVDDEIKLKINSIQNFEKQILDGIFKLFISMVVIAVLFYRLNILIDLSHSSETVLVLRNRFNQVHGPLQTAFFKTKSRILGDLLNSSRFLIFSKIDLYNLEAISTFENFYETGLASLTLKLGYKDNTYTDFLFKKLRKDKIYDKNSLLQTLQNSCRMLEPSLIDNSNHYLSFLPISPCLMNKSVDYFECHEFKSTFKRKNPDTESLIECLENLPAEIRSLKYEINLYNFKLRQLIYVNYGVYFEGTGPKGQKIGIEVVSIDKSLLFFSTEEKSKLASLVILVAILLIQSYKLVRIVSKHGLTRVLFEFSNLIDLFGVYCFVRLFYFETKVFFEILNHLHVDNFRSNRFSSLQDLTIYYKETDLMIGLILFNSCLTGLTKSSLINKLTKNIVLTFKHCYKDLLGFMVILAFLILSYTFAFYFYMGPKFREFSTLSKCYMILLKLIWGEFEFDKFVARDWKAFVLVMSYLIFIVIIMFNIMLAIILGKYDLVQREPIYRRDAANLKLDEYFYLLTEKVLAKHLTVKNKLILFVLKKLTFNLRARRRLFCVRDVEEKLSKAEFKREHIRECLDSFSLKPWTQIDKYKVEILIKTLFELEYEKRERLRINDERLINDYVTNKEWQALMGRHHFLESFFSCLERSQVLIGKINGKRNNNKSN